MEETVLSQYVLEGISGYEYSPRYQNGKWYIVGNVGVDLDEVIRMFRIPSEEAVYLKLKYSE
jgi:hypothetical protein